MGLFSRGKKKEAKEPVAWIQLTSTDALEKAFEETSEVPALFFKHSTRCSISSMALSRFESNWKNTEQCNVYFIDLIAHRDVSNLLADISGVEHQSPQAILVKDKSPVYNASHSGISTQSIVDLI